MSDFLPDALRDPNAFPWPVNRVDIIETHISWVFLAGNRVVKLKRPVHYSFVDYSTPERRRAACEDEVRLNRRLADDIYIGVVPIIQTPDGIRVSGDGDIIDWATLMRRIDDREILDTRLAEDRVPEDLAIRIADRLVPFHMHAARCTGALDDVLATQETVLRDNLAELAPYDGLILPTLQLRLVREAVESFLDDWRPTMHERIARGWIRDGHGDLRCEHIVVPETDPIQIYDCVEFNRDLRCADVASDLAFLLMDLARLDAPVGTISSLLDRYADAGIDVPPGLLQLYWIHRALVRAKVHCLQTDQPDVGRRMGARQKAVNYLHMATLQALITRPMIIAMTGLSGTGKSTVARALSQILDAPRIASDIVRKELAASAQESDDIYTDAWTDRTYNEMYRRGRNAVSAGNMVILDATFLDPARCAEAMALAASSDMPLVLVETVADADVVERRLLAREKQGTSISDATIQVYRQQRDRAAEHPSRVPDGVIHVIVDTSADGPVSLDPILTALLDADLIEPRIDQVSPITG